MDVGGGGGLEFPIGEGLQMSSGLSFSIKASSIPWFDHTVSHIREPTSLCGIYFFFRDMGRSGSMR